MTTLGERLRHRDQRVFDEAVRAAVVEGPPGEAELIAALADGPESRQVFIIAVLGDAQGDAGPAALRNVLSTSTRRDVLCAAVLALAKRSGPDASADLASALASRDTAVKNYAMLGLAGAGDDRAWDAAFIRLKQLLRRPGPPPSLRPQFLSVQSPVAAAICYLGRHVDGRGGSRTIRLVRELREHWDHIGSGEQSWLAETWPAFAPGGPDEADIPEPDGQRLQQWIRDPLFKPVY